MSTQKYCVYIKKTTQKYCVQIFELIDNCLLKKIEVDNINIGYTNNYFTTIQFYLIHIYMSIEIRN
jgi:hypothetical protein